nr:MAG TPA: hypothetical protein [Caudoviricetes sp.]
MTGSIISFNEKRGFGFIKAEDSTIPQRYFCHISNFMNLEAYPKPGQRVRFELKASAKGEEAVDIQIII